MPLTIGEFSNIDLQQENATLKRQRDSLAVTLSNAEAEIGKLREANAFLQNNPQSSEKEKESTSLPMPAATAVNTEFESKALPDKLEPSLLVPVVVAASSVFAIAWIFGKRKKR